MTSARPPAKKLGYHHGDGVLTPLPDEEPLLAAHVPGEFERLLRDLLETDRHSNPAEALVEQGAVYVAFTCADPVMFRSMSVGRSAGVRIDVTASKFVALQKRRS